MLPSGPDYNGAPDAKLQLGLLGNTHLPRESLPLLSRRLSLREAVRTSRDSVRAEVAGDIENLVHSTRGGNFHKEEHFPLLVAMRPCPGEGTGGTDRRKMDRLPKRADYLHMVM